MVQDGPELLLAVKVGLSVSSTVVCVCVCVCVWPLLWGEHIEPAKLVSILPL